MGGYKLFRRDRRGGRDGRVALYVRDCLSCLELNDGVYKVECLVKNQGQGQQDRYVGSLL